MCAGVRRPDPPGFARDKYTRRDSHTQRPTACSNLPREQAILTVLTVPDFSEAVRAGNPAPAEQAPLVARSVAPPPPPTSPRETMERGDDTARSTLWGPSAACTSILYRVCYGGGNSSFSRANGSRPCRSLCLRFPLTLLLLLFRLRCQDSEKKENTSSTPSFTQLSPGANACYTCARVPTI